MMKRVVAVAAGWLFLLFFAAVNASAADSSRKQAPAPRQGIVNAKKAMLSKAEHDKKVAEVRKKGQMKKQQAAKGK